MKKYYDKIFEMLKKNNIRRRRIMAIVLVLSLFTSSGVVWVLRDIGITMVNEAVCGIEEHSHSDSCFDENGTMVCKVPEHIHTVECFLTDKFPDLMLNNGVDLLADENYLRNPQVVQTIDNTSRGITFTLFDYHVYKKDSDGNIINDIWNEDPAGSNNFGYARDENDNVIDQHNEVIYSGINSGREDWQNNILFFDYGTPPPRSNQTNSDGSYQAGTPGKNNYSGDYNGNSYQSGNRPIQGIVQNTLDGNGYPVVNGNSLDYLFDNSIRSSDGLQHKWVYNNVNRLLQEVNGHLVYDSNKNYAELQNVNNGQSESYNFNVYDRTYDIISKDHHKEGETYKENGNDVVADSTVNPGFKIGFFPFNQYNVDHRDPNWNSDGYYNHHFGMKMNAKFQLPKYTDEPITFSYSGDDDMWVFIDGVLVLDVGGIHEPSAGMIDFTNGLVWVQDNANNPSYGGKTLDELKNSWGFSASFDSVPKPTGCNENEVPKWIVKTINEYFQAAGKGNWNPDTGEHSLDMFYLERGGCYSNLSMDMNLPTVGTLTVAKEVDFGSHLSNAYDNNTYYFDVYEEGNPTPVASDIALKNGERTVIGGLNTDKRYYVVEKNIDTTYINSTKFVDVWSGEQLFYNCNTVESTRHSLSEQSIYKFTNIIGEEGGLKVTKKWEPEPDTFDDSKYTVRYKIYKSENGGDYEAVIHEDGFITQSLTRADTYEGQPWTKFYPSLPTKYGNITFAYMVVEDPIPGYKASATYENGVATLVNTDENKVEINVKKEWLHTPNGNAVPVHVQLKRLKAQKTTAADAKVEYVIIRAVDDGGNVMYSHKVGANQTISGGNTLIAAATDKEVYVGGELEFRADINGCEIPQEGHIEVNTSATCERIAGNNYILKNIQPGTVVTLHYNRIDGATIFHDSFTGGNMNGWKAFGDTSEGGESTTITSTNYQLVVRNRDIEWKGAAKALENYVTAGNTYSFAVKVKKDNNNDSYGQNLQLTLQYRANGSDQYITLDTNDTTVNEGEWILLSGKHAIPSGAENIIIKVETPQNSNNMCDFRIDEAIAVSGDVNITDINYDQNIVFRDKFGDNDRNGWYANGDNVQVSIDSVQTTTTTGGSSKQLQIMTSGSEWYALNDAVLVKGRDATHEGAYKDLNQPDFVPGNPYSFAVYVKRSNNDTSGDSQAKFVLTLQYVLNNETRYIRLDDVENNGNGWSLLAGSGLIPEGATNVMLRVESESGLCDFRMDEAVAVKGIVDIDIATDGRVSLSKSDSKLAGSTLIDSNFDSGQSSNWIGKIGDDNTNTAVQGFAQDENNKFLLVAGSIEDNDMWRIQPRQYHNQGARLMVPSLVPGKTYEFYFNVGNHVGHDMNSFIAGIYDGNDYKWLVNGPRSLDTSKDWDRIGISSTFTIPSNANTGSMFVYLETQSITYDYNGDQKGETAYPFRIYDFNVREVITAPFYTEAPEGYERDGANYNKYIQTNACTAEIEVSADSITHPILSVENLEYVEDTGFNKEIQLDLSNNWSYQWLSSTESWQQNYISEDSNYAYLYYIVENRIGDNVYPSTQYDGFYPISNTYGDYFIEYPVENGISSNTSDSPLVIKNTYVWYMLPATGGMGTTPIYTAGVFMVLTGLVSGCIIRKRKRRYNEAS